VEIRKNLTRWCVSTMWNDGWEWGISGHKHELFASHFQGNTIALRGMLESAIAADDDRIRQFLREAADRIFGLAVSDDTRYAIHAHKMLRAERAGTKRMRRFVSSKRFIWWYAHTAGWDCASE
jgi:hypothetical protein